MPLKPGIPEREFLERVKMTRRVLSKQGIDLLVCFSLYPEREGNMEYLVNYHGAFPPSASDGTYVGLGYSALALSQSELVLFPGLLFATGKLVGVDRVAPSENIPLSLAEYASKSIGRKKGTIGIVGEEIIPSLYLEEFKKKTRKSCFVRFVNANEILSAQRIVKSAAEQSILGQGAKIADIGLEAAYNATRAGVREAEIGLAAMKACYEQGADYVVRTRIYGAGISGVRWPILTNRKVASKEITGVDLVGWFQGYGFDVLRRWVVGPPSAKQRDFLEKAATMTEETWKRIRPGMNGNQVSEISISLSKELGLGMEDVSPFGHAIGLEIVENPFLLPRSKGVVLKDQVLCVEPGIESKEFGSVHFEDEVLVTDGGVKVLSKRAKL